MIPSWQLLFAALGLLGTAPAIALLPDSAALVEEQSITGSEPRPQASAVEASTTIIADASIVLAVPTPALDERVAWVNVSAQGIAVVPVGVLERGQWYSLRPNNADRWSYNGDKGPWTDFRGDPRKERKSSLTCVEAAVGQMIVYAPGRCARQGCPWVAVNHGMHVQIGPEGLNLQMNDSKSNDNRGSILVDIH